MRRPGRATTEERVGAVAVALVLGAAGCNLIAGINDGTLVAADSGADGRVPRREGGVADGSAGKEGGTADGGTGKDGGKDAAKDGTKDAGPLPTYGCATIDHAIPQKLMDLSTFDSGAYQFTQSIFLAQGGNGDLNVVAQPQGQSQQTPFVAFDIYGNGFGSASFGTQSGIQLLEARNKSGATPPVVEVLTTYSSVNNQDSLQLVSLPTSFNGSTSGAPQFADAAATPLSTLTDGGAYGGGLFVDLDGGRVGYLALERAPGPQNVQTLVFGVGPGGTESPIASAPESAMIGGLNTVQNDTFYALGTSLYAFTPGVPGGPDGGLPEYVTAENPLAASSSPGSLLTPLVAIDSGVGPPTFWALLGAQASTVEPGKVVLLAVSANLQTGPFTLYGATVSPSSIKNLRIGGPSFTSTVVQTAPVGSATGAWGPNDYFALAGQGANGVGLVWLGPTSQVIAVGELNRMNPIGTAAVLFEPGAKATEGAVFDLAWTEKVPASNGPGYIEQLYTVRMQCTPGSPTPDGG